MKRYIRSATEVNPFNMKTTGTSYYDRFLNEKDLKYMQDEKNLTGKIVWGTPQEYFDECAEMFGKSVNQLIRSRSDGDDKQYAEMMKNGVKFDLPYLHKLDGLQEGLHRMLAAAMAFGWDVKVPWLEIQPYDMDRYNEAKLAREASDYFNWSLGDVISKADRNISDWESPVPDNFETLFAREIEKCAAEDGHNIEVDIEVREVEGHPKVAVYLLSYDGYELPASRPHEKGPWLEDMFDIDANSDSNEISELDLDDIDLDDIDSDDDDIASLLFK